MISMAPYDRDDNMIKATANDGKTRFAITRPTATTVVLGRGSQVEKEIDVLLCQQRNIPIVRRRGGGCSVLLDPGQLVVSLAMPAQGIGDNNLHFKRITDALVEALAECGIPGVELTGISDLTLNGKKIGGSCIYRQKGLLYYSTTLLFAPNVDLMELVLRHPPREPEYRKSRSHRDFCGSIRSSLPIEQWVPKLFAALKRKWGQTTDPNYQPPFQKFIPWAGESRC